MKRNIIFAIVFISPPFLKKWILRVFCRAKIARKARIGWFSSVSGSKIEMASYSDIRACTIIRCDGEVKIGAYSAISNFCLIYGSGGLLVGEHSYIGPQCILNIDEDIVLGDNSGIGPRSMLFTHGSFLPYTEGYKNKFGSIQIGNYVWLPAGVFIHPGVNIGDHVLVNSMSVIRRDIPSGIVADGFPAEQVSETEKIRRKLTPEMVDKRISDMVSKFSEIILNRGLHIKFDMICPSIIQFTWKKKLYRIQILTSIEDKKRSDKELGVSQSTVMTIFLVNKPECVFTQSKRVLFFDFPTKQMSKSNNFIFQELKRFMQRYFGERFHYIEK